MTRTTSRHEEDTDKRLQLMNSILRCPHRDLDMIAKVHDEVREADPEFYARLAAWHKVNGEIRDHNEVFVGMLLTDSFLDNRETGLALLRAMPPHMKERVKGFIKGKPIKIRHKTGKKVKARQGGKKKVDEVRIEKKIVGLKVNMPRSVKTEITAYLRWLEADDDRFDTVALANFSPLMGLYASFQIKPSPRAKAIIFEKQFPEGSKLSVIKDILEANSPVKQAELIIKHKIGYTTAVGLIRHMTPSVITALVSVMSPQEVVNSVNSLKERGAFDNADLKKLIMAKLEQAEKAKNVSGLKAQVAKKAAKVEDEEVAAQLDRVTNTSIRKKATIKMPTAVIVDKSRSMEKAIEVGKRVASLISGATESDIYVYVSDYMAKEIRCRGEKTMTNWEKAFAGVRADGATSIGAGVALMQKQDRYVEQIVLVTDEGENRGPMIGQAIKSYKKKFNVEPNVVVVRIEALAGYNDPSWIANFRAGLKDAVGEYSYYDLPSGDDYYALPGLVPMLAQGSRLDLLYEIMDTDLPTREAFEKYVRLPKAKKKVAKKKAPAKKKTSAKRKVAKK